MTTAGGISLDIQTLALPDWVEVRPLTVNPYSRPCVAMDSIQYIAIHYVGNAGTTADQNWSYFEGLKDTHVTKASSHFIVGLEGEVISCIPLNEMSYCTNQRNVDTISIEVCHPDAGGQFTPATYQSVVQLTAWLCKTFGLTQDNVIRHYDVTGKICPKYYVEHEDAWVQLKADIGAALTQ
ncbi:MAG: N-acetylmuramoyl-L-alanine amidase [Lachnospiraceae bacterium]|nr:N-acetylmuramoyl-L-alanine amidase [Lachnospiraceae bacterium]